MKKARRILAAVLALFLLVGIVCVGIPMASASAPTGNIVISNTTEVVQYKIYKILDLESYDAASGNYSYSIKKASDWYDFVATGDGTTYLALMGSTDSTNTANYVVARASYTDTAHAVLFAKDALKYASTHSIDPITIDPSKTSFVDGVRTFTGLEHGYYVVESSRGTALAVSTVLTEGASFVEKNNLPAISKAVQENSTMGWVTENDAGYGDIVKYEITVTAAANAKNYVIHDKLAAGIQFNNDVDVQVYWVDNSVDPSYRNLVDDSNYVLTLGAPDGCTIDITFKQTFCDTLDINDKVIVAYTGKVLDTAAQGHAAVTQNKNSATLMFGTDGVQEIRKSNDTVTYTYQLNVSKVKTGGELLNGATFVLQNDLGQWAQVGVDGKLDGWTAVEGARTVFGGAGVNSFSIIGLDAGTYTLTELEAPTGYNKLSGDITIMISADHHASTMTLGLTGPGAYDANRNYATGIASFKVENTSGTILPSTGGMGTTIFYVVGVVLVLGAVALLVTKKRVSAK